MIIDPRSIDSNTTFNAVLNTTVNICVCFDNIEVDFLVLFDKFKAFHYVNHRQIFVSYYVIAQSAGAVEYTDCFSAEG